MILSQDSCVATRSSSEMPAMKRSYTPEEGAGEGEEEEEGSGREPSSDAASATRTRW